MTCGISPDNSLTKSLSRSTPPIFVIAPWGHRFFSPTEHDGIDEGKGINFG
jgi:hypothetical protein